MQLSVQENGDIIQTVTDRYDQEVIDAIWTNMLVQVFHIPL